MSEDGGGARGTEPDPLFEDPPAHGPRRPGGSRRGARIVAGVAFAAAGLLLTSSAIAAHGTDLRGGRAVDTRDLVARSAQRVAEQESDVEDLQREVEALTAQQGTGDALATSQRTTAALAPAAGLTPVVGPGVRVSLDDAPASARGKGGASPDDLVVHQQDVQAVVNALWRGGASAVQVMDQRIVSTSAVRCVGNTLLLQGRVYSPPFVVTAIGDAGRMTRTLDGDPQVSLYRDYVDQYGLGYLVRDEQSLTIPAFRGSVLPQHASVATR